MFGGGGGGWGKLFCLLSGFNFYENTLTLNFPNCKDASMVVSHSSIGKCVICKENSAFKPFPRISEIVHPYSNCYLFD